MDNSNYNKQFQVIVDSSNGGVTDRTVEDTEVLVSKIDGDMKVESVKNLKKARMEDGAEGKEERPKVLFISHSTDDKLYMEAFIKILNFLGLHEDEVVCTSVEGYGIPLGENIYKWLIEKFQTCDIHVIFVLSHNYYQSAASLNEMGAAWVTQQKWDGLLLPGFDFSEVKGCIDKDQMSLKLDAENASHKLGELRDELIKEFGLRKPSETGWEKYRNEFLKGVQEIYEKKKTRLERIEMGNDYRLDSAGFDPITTHLREMELDGTSMVLLAYASQDPQGQIIVMNTSEGTAVSTCSWDFVSDNTSREAARWKGAVDSLLYWGLIKFVGRKDKIYEVTDKGYQMAEGIIVDNEIDVRNNPKDYLKDMRE